MMMDALGIPIDGHDYDSACSAISRVTQPIENALTETFTNRQSVIPDMEMTPFEEQHGVNWDRDIAMKQAILHSDIYQTLPFYWPEERSWEEQRKSFSGSELSIAQKEAIVSILHSALEPKIFAKLNCRNKAVIEYKNSLGAGHVEKKLPQMSASRNTATQTPPTTQQQLRYGQKKAIRKDKIGVGCLLEAIGLGICLFTLLTIIGPIIGLAVFGCGFAIARQKRFVCVNCGNELSPESKFCPACSAIYEQGVLHKTVEILGKAVLAIIIIGVVVLYFGGKDMRTNLWQKISSSGQDSDIDPMLTTGGGKASSVDEKNAREIGGFNGTLSSSPKDSSLLTTPSAEGNPSELNLPKIDLSRFEERDLILEREWEDLKGRKLQAALKEVTKNESGAYIGHFRRPNGEEFEYAILKLSRSDRELIKNTMIREKLISE